MAVVLTPAQEAARKEAIRALAVLLALEITGQNHDDAETPMPNSLGEPAEPLTAANSPFPESETDAHGA
jgi:hypothetical protein